MQQVANLLHLGLANWLRLCNSLAPYFLWAVVLFSLRAQFRGEKVVFAVQGFRLRVKRENFAKFANFLSPVELFSWPEEAKVIQI